MTETTIQDVYNINLEATFQTQVPAPVVLLEPLSINLPDLQVGEEFTGELTLTNYGLIQADSVVFKPPQRSDEYYKYEFLADIPKTLAAKQRIVIPTGSQLPSCIPRAWASGKSASEQSELQQRISKAVTAKASSCSSYANFAT